MAAWLVSHAQQYQIDDVRYAGYQWTRGQRRTRMVPHSFTGSAGSRRGWLIACDPWGRKRSEQVTYIITAVLR